MAILNYNGRTHLAYSVPSVLAQDYPSAAVVVVDNASTDGSVEWVRRTFPNVGVLSLPANVGYSALNVAVDGDERAEFVLLMTNDIVLEPRALSHAVEVASAHSDVGIIGFEMLGAQRWVDPSALAEASARMDRPALRDAEWIEGAAMLVRRRLLGDLGGIDAAYFAYCDEDDLQWRVRWAGYRCVKITTPVWHNAGRNALATVPRHSAYLQMRNYIRYRTKNWGAWEGIKAAAWIAYRACCPGIPVDRTSPYESRHRPFSPLRNAAIVAQAWAWNVLHARETLRARRETRARIRRVREERERA